MQCHRCGRQINDGDAYCSVCGAKQWVTLPPATEDANGRPGWMQKSERPFAHICTVDVPAKHGASAGAIAIILLAVLVIGAVASVMFRGEVSSTQHTFTGQLRLYNNSSNASGIAVYGGSCTGANGYSDIGSGTQVTVMNESGKVLATTSLAPGSGVIVCTFAFSVKVPSASFYRIAVGSERRGVMTYSRQDMEANSWTVDLTIGS